MISNAFKSAYVQKESARNRGLDNISEGIKTAGTLALGATGFAGGLGKGILSKASKFALAGKVGGVGGAIMMASMEEKAVSVKAQKMFSEEEVQETIASNLGDNPINRSAKKQLSMVFEKLTQAKESGIINKAGMIESSLGDIDPNSELGKKIISQLGGEDGNDR